MKKKRIFSLQKYFNTKSEWVYNHSFRWWLYNIVARLGDWLTDDGGDIPKWKWDLWDSATDFVEKLNGILCKLFGHHPTHDHCGMPEHMYCRWCRVGTPDLSTEKNIYRYFYDLDKKMKYRTKKELETEVHFYHDN